jgi:hypothetical protein
VATCEYCKTSCLIPARALQRDAHSVPKPTLWWQLWTGPSEERTQLEAGPTAQAVALFSGISGLGGIGPVRQKVLKLPDRPGVHEAPEAPGTNWEQVATNAAFGVFALGVGYVVARLIGH